MPSLHETSTSTKPLLLCLARLLSVLLVLGCSGVRGASLREHRLWGSESDPERGDVYPAPNSDMLKALEYIQGLHQRTGQDSPTSPQQQQQRAPLAAGSDAGLADDAEKLRAMLRLASNPAQSNDEEDQEEEEEEGGREDKSEELLQAVLSTLQQTEKTSKPTRPKPESPGAKQHGIMPHKKLPLMFEDEEDEEGEGDEEDEDGGAPERDSPFKRTNENVEEKYTPQNLATLQSVFDELDKLTSTKMLRKRQDEEDSVEDGEELQDEDMFNVRDVAYDDMEGNLADWGPLGEQEEEDEEEDRHEVNRGLDYNDDGEEQEEEEEEEDDGRYLAKRSSDPDDMANLVDYYLLKVLEKTEEEEQKREIEEEEEEREEEEEKKRAAQSIDPRLVYQLIRVSQKYQIPPEDLLDMLKTTDKTSQSKLRKVNELPREKSRLAQIYPKKTHRFPDFYSRRPAYRQKTPEQLRTAEVLRILGLGGPEDPAPAAKPRLHKSFPSRLRAQQAAHPGEPAATQRRLPASSRNDYNDQDELAAYLAAQMLARYPKPAYGGGRAGVKRDEAGQAAAGSLDKAMEEYYDQMDSDNSRSEKRRSEDEERGADTRGQGFEDDAVMMKLLDYLNPETNESDAKDVQGN